LVVSILQFLMNLKLTINVTNLKWVNIKMRLISLIVFQSSKSRIGSDSSTVISVIYSLIQRFGVDELSKSLMVNGTLLYFSKTVRLYFLEETTKVNVYCQSLKGYELSRSPVADITQQFYTRTGQLCSSAKTIMASAHYQTASTKTL